MHSRATPIAADSCSTWRRCTRAQQGGHGYVVLMVDIDHFKAINDRHGHAEGDSILKRVAQNLRDGLRVGDVVARWGWRGVPACCLPHIGLAEAHALAQRMATQIAATGKPCRHSEHRCG